MQELLDEIDVIEVFEQHGNALRVGEVTKTPVKCYKAFYVTPPNTL